MAAARGGAAVLLAVLGALAWTVVAGGSQPYDTYQTTVTTDGPVAQYRFDDAAGSKTLADSAGTFTATNGGITLGGTGPFGGSKSGSFGGAAYASLASSPLASATAFSAEGWVNWTGGASYKQPIFDFGSSTTNYMYLTPASALTNHTMLFEIRTTAGTVFQVTAPTLTAKAWVYVAVTETTSGTLTLYLNGAQVGQTTGATISPSSLGSTANDWLGKSQVAADPMFNGSLSNVAFYTKALSAERILAHYNAGVFPVNTVLPTIAGTAKDGQTLTASPGTWTGVAPITFAYQWTRCNTAGAECVSITSATNTTYQAAHEDVGKTLRVGVTGKNTAGSGGATSNQTATVAALAPSSTVLPAISGAAKDGQLLTVSNGSWNGTPPLSYTYQWEACNTEGSGCSNISGATASSYRVITSQIGKTLRAIITAKNTAGSAAATSEKTATIIAGPPVNTALPAISGTAKDGQTLTASTGTWAGTAPITYTYRWQACNSTGGECANISGATASTFVLGSSSVSRTIHVTVTATNSSGAANATSPTTAVVSEIPPSNSALPTISGTAKNGQTLSASTGTWTGSQPMTYAYQWQRCDAAGANCSAISGAAAQTYLVGTSDIGKTLRVAVTASNLAGGSAPSSSAQTVVVQQGSATFGKTSVGVFTDGGMFANYKIVHTATLSGSGSMTKLSLYATPGLNSPSPQVLKAVVYSDSAGSPGALVATGTEVTYRGNVNGSGWLDLPFAAPVALTPGTYWLGFITGATTEGMGYAYDELAGSRAYNENTYASGPTNPFGSSTKDSRQASIYATYTLPLPPVNTTPPAIGGVAKDGQTLSASTGSWTESPTSYTYQWQSCNSTGGNCTNITGATSSTYTLGHGEVGTTLQVIVKAMNSGGSASSTSAITAVVAALAPANTGLPTTSGTTQESQTLIASAGSWTGTPPLEYGYQWERCNASGGECVNITGATSRRYTLVKGDVASTIRVVATASNAAGSAPATSAATAVISLATLPANTALPTTSGTTQESQPLIANVGTWTGAPPLAYAYQWERCNASGGECVNITGATNRSYILVKGDAGSTIRIVVTASNAAGSVPATSSASAVIAAATPPVNTALPTISGSILEGQTLVSSTGSWSGTPPTYTYQWRRCNASGGECVNITGATNRSYILVKGDVGSTIRIVVTASNAAGTVPATSAASAVIAAATLPVNTVLPAISGTVQDGQTLLASSGAWTGTSATYAYQWQSCNPQGKECQNIAQAINQGYTLSSGDLETTLRVVVTATNAAGSAQATSAVSAKVEPGAPSEQEAPSVSGSPWAGETLLASAGVWEGTDAEVSYQWQSCNPTGGECANVAGATEAEYKLGTGDIETTLRVRIGVRNARASVTAISSATQVIGAPSTLLNTWPPSISGIRQSGQTLAANPGSWVGSSAISYSYQWQSCNRFGSACKNIEGASASSYLLSTGEAGSTLRVLVNATEPNGTASEASLVTQPIAAEYAPVLEEAPVISGTGLPGYALTATVGGWSGEGPITYGYQWERCSESGESCSPIGGATASSYTLTSADAGATVRVLVTATGIGGATEAPSSAITVSPPTLTELAPPSISGVDQLSNTLSANPGIWTGPGAISYAYQWERCNSAGQNCTVVAGATSSTYTSGVSDLGKAMKVTVTASGTSGQASSPSAQTSVIASEPTAPANTAAPSIEGNPTSGSTLTAVVGSWSGSEPITYTYQWQSCDEEGENCTNIKEATGQTYLPGSGNVGSSLRVVVTATNAVGSESVTSPQSEVVGAPGPPVAKERPVINGTAKQGQQLFAGNGQWSGSRPLSYFYRWERCNSKGESCANITGATKPSYPVASADVGSSLRVSVTVSNSLGSASSVSAQALVSAATEANVTEALEIAQKT